MSVPSDLSWTLSTELGGDCDATTRQTLSETFEDLRTIFLRSADIDIRHPDFLAQLESEIPRPNSAIIWASTSQKPQCLEMPLYKAWVSLLSRHGEFSFYAWLAPRLAGVTSLCPKGAVR